MRNAAVLAVVCACSIFAPASADIAFPAYDYGNPGLGIEFDIGFSYSHSLDGKNGTIDVTVGNPVSNPSYVSITGLAFNAPTGYDLSLNAFSFDSPLSATGFDGELDFDGIRAGSYGKFDLGISTDKIKNSINGGTPRYGIRPSDTATFSLNFSGNNLDELDEYTTSCCSDHRAHH